MPPRELIWCTQSYFTLLRGHQGPSRFLTVFLGILWSFIRQVKAHYLFDGEHGIAVHAMEGNRTSSLSEGEVLCFFSSCGGILGYIIELSHGLPFKTLVCSVTSGLRSS